jgi:hypothetical protein
MMGGFRPPAAPSGPPAGFSGGGFGMMGGAPGMTPPGGGPFQPGFNPGGQPGADDVNKGKDGTWALWSRDKVVALNLNLSLRDAHYQMVVNELESLMVLFRGKAELADTRPRIHELAAGIQAYVKDKGTFPPGALHRPVSSQHVLDWRPDQRLSWLVEVLPYLPTGDYGTLRDKLDNDKSWSEGNNAIVAQAAVPQFLSSSKPSDDNPFWYQVRYPGNDHKLAATHYVGVAGVGLDAAEYKAGDPAVAKKLGVFGYDRVTRPGDIKDGLESTIVALQIPAEHATPWIAGGGSTLRGISEEDDCLLPFVCADYQGQRGTFAIMADGKVRFIPENMPPKTFRALCTIAGSEVVRNLDQIAPVVEGDSGPVLKATGAPPAAEVKPAEAPKAPEKPKAGEKPADKSRPAAPPKAGDKPEAKKP